MYAKSLILVTCLGLLPFGCSRSPSQPTALPSAAQAKPLNRELTERDLEVIEFVLRERAGNPEDRIYFLTATPMDNWGEDGAWADLPDSFYRRIADLPTRYRKASEAAYKDYAVVERSSGREAWMQWVTVKRWISDTEVEVEAGVWCCPLGGGASTTIYEKVDGQWKLKELGSSWVS